MNLFELLALIAVTGCVTAVVLVERNLGARRRAHAEELWLAEQRLQEQLQRITELERHNQELRQPGAARAAGVAPQADGGSGPSSPTAALVR
jgi:hypothetical protein